LFAMTPPPLPEPVHTPPKKFELPEMRVHETATQTLLQAEAPPNLPPQLDKRLPQLVLWDAERSKPHPRPFDPGNLTAKTQTPKLSSTPLLEPPNLEANTSTMQVASVISNKPPTLPLPPANTMPLRLLQGSKNAGGQGSIDPFTGEPVHVLALSTDPLMDDTLKALVIPAGNQLARLPGAAPAPGASGFGDGSGDGTAPESSGTGNGKPGGASGTPGGVGASSLFGMLSPLGLTGTPLRILHPNNGVFDIVVVQSTAVGTFPDGAEVLSGRPIYTVYLQVGASKEWILQYCIPNSVGSIQTGSLVQLGNPTPVRAPYPMVTLRPPEDWRHGADYLLVHGFLDESGRFRDMKILPSRHPTLPTTGALLQYLAHWEFRPAVQDGHPVKIEVLLAVPPDRMS